MLLLVVAPRSAEEDDLCVKGVKVVDADYCECLCSAILDLPLICNRCESYLGQEHGNCHMEISTPQVLQLLSKSTFKLSSWQPR